jgi:hypothetical protein
MSDESGAGREVMKIEEIRREEDQRVEMLFLITHHSSPITANGASE